MINYHVPLFFYLVKYGKTGDEGKLEDTSILMTVGLCVLAQLERGVGHSEDND